MRAAMLLALCVCLAACTGPSPTPTANVAATQTRERERVLLATLSAPTATPTAIPTPTATLSPTVPPPPTVTPTTSPTATRPSAATPRLPGDDYVADFGRWAQQAVAGSYRTAYDPGAGEYHIAVDERSPVGRSIYTPDGARFGDFTLDVTTRRVAGQNDFASGVVFRRRADGARYEFFVSANGWFALRQVGADSTVRQLQAAKYAAAIRRGDAPNRLTVVCLGATITLRINGQVVGTYTSDAIGSGYVGLIVVMVASPATPTAATPVAATPTAVGAPLFLEAAFGALRVTAHSGAPRIASGDDPTAHGSSPAPVAHGVASR